MHCALHMRVTVLTDDDAERAGRVIAGKSTLEQVQAVILRQHGCDAVAGPGA